MFTITTTTTTTIIVINIIASIYQTSILRQAPSHTLFQPKIHRNAATTSPYPHLTDEETTVPRFLIFTNVNLADEYFKLLEVFNLMVTVYLYLTSQSL